MSQQQDAASGTNHDTLHLEQVVAEAKKALEWLAEKQKLQESLRKTDDPVLTSADIKKREETIVRFFDPILSKPAPPPPKVYILTQLFLKYSLLVFWGFRGIKNRTLNRKKNSTPEPLDCMATQPPKVVHTAPHCRRCGFAGG